MKKLITLSIILLFATNTFGQTQGIFGRISDEAEYQRFEREFGSVASHINGTALNYRDLETRTYSFIKDSMLYMLSYDTCKACTKSSWYGRRELYLFRWKDGVWSKASDVICVDQRFENFGIDGYLPMFNGIHGESVTVMKGNTILVKLARHYIPDGSFSRSGICSSEISIMKFVLMPNDDGTYNILR